MEQRVLERSAILFSALSNPVRLKITNLLVDQPSSVNEIAQAMRIGQSGASQHLSILARAGVVVARAHGTTRVYAVRGPRIGKILNLITEFCEVHQLHGDSDIEHDQFEQADGSVG